MAEEVTQPVEEQEDDRSIWDILGVNPPDEDNEEEDESYAEIAADVERETEKEDKLAKKLTAKVDNMQKKFDAAMLSQAKEKFLASANPIERDLFKAVSADVRDMDSLGRIAEMVKEKSKSVQAIIDQAEQQAKVEAAAKAHTAWGLGGAPIGGAPTQSDEDKDLADRIAKGDTKAAMKAMFSDDPVLGGLFH